MTMMMHSAAEREAIVYTNRVLADLIRRLNRLPQQPWTFDAVAALEEARDTMRKRLDTLPEDPDEPGAAA